MNDLPLVTVGVASYNNSQYLRETLESVRQQTYPHIELIIVDDASSDDSVAVAEAWLAEFPQVQAQLVRHATNLGICPTFNDVVKRARGEFVCIIGSDDVYLPDKLSHQVPLLLNAPSEIGVVYSPVDVMDANGGALPPMGEWHNTPEGNVFLDLLRGNFIPAMGGLVRRKCYDVVGLYDEELVFEDIDMWLRISRVFEFIYSPVVSAKYRRHGNSAAHSRYMDLAESSIKLLQKHMGISQVSDRLINEQISQAAERLYQWNSPNATHWLKKRWKNDKKVSSLFLYLVASAGIKGSLVVDFQRRLGR